MPTVGLVHDQVLNGESAKAFQRTLASGVGVSIVDNRETGRMTAATVHWQENIVKNKKKRRKRCCKFDRGEARKHAIRQSAAACMLGDIQQEDLNYWQRKASRILMHPSFQLTMSLVIVWHMLLTVQQTDQHAAEAEPARWQGVVERAFLVMYWIDILLRLFTLRKEFVAEYMNVFDFTIVAVDTIVTVLDTLYSGSFDIGPISLLRAMRALRIVRVIRNFTAFRELYLMMKGMGSAMRAIFFAVFLILVVLTMFSIAAVEIINPLNKELAADGSYDDCDWCDKAFASVMDANLTFFSSILAGDSWGKLAIPLIKADPSTAIIILSAFVILELGLLNVIIAVVVDRQAQARESDKDLMHTIKEEQAAANYKELLTLFQSMDNDGSGALNIDELCESFQTVDQFRQILAAIDVSVEDLATVFSAMDRDHGESVDYEEFVAELHRMRTMEVRTLVYLTRQHVLDIKETLREFEQKFFNMTKDPENQRQSTMSNSSGENDLRMSFAPELFSASEKVKQVPSTKVDESWRILQLEQQFSILENRMEQTATLSQQWMTSAASLASPLAKDDATERDVQNTEQIKANGFTTKEGFADEMVPELTPSGAAAPGRDLRCDEFELMHEIDKRPKPGDLTSNLDGPKRQARGL